MHDSRMYPDRYDRHAAATPESNSGEVLLHYAGAPTASGEPCRFMPKAGTWRMDAEGSTLNYDAELRIPESQTLLPEKRGDNPDKVVVTQFAGATISRAFKVLMVRSNFGQHKRAFLQELMP